MSRFRGEKHALSFAQNARIRMDRTNESFEKVAQKNASLSFYN